VLNFIATCVKKGISWELLSKRILVFHILLLFKFITFTYLNYFTFNLIFMFALNFGTCI